MGFLGDKVCQYCDGLVPEGSSVCKKCGETVKGSTGSESVDFARDILPHFTHRFGRFWGTLFAVLIGLIVLALAVGSHILMMWRDVKPGPP
jgi:hypothetical protein